MEEMIAVGEAMEDCSRLSANTTTTIFSFFWQFSLTPLMK